MRLSEVREAVEEIRREASEGHNEAAHRLEDDLHAEVLAHYARSSDGVYATVALETRNIEFERWYA